MRYKVANDRPEKSIEMHSFQLYKIYTALYPSTCIFLHDFMSAFVMRTNCIFFVMMIVSFNKWARRSFSLTHPRPRPRLRLRVGACSTYALHSHTHSYSINVYLYDCQVTKQSICAIFHRNPKRAHEHSHCFHSIMIAFAIVAACFFMQFVMHI